MNSDKRDMLFKKRCSDFGLILESMQIFEDVIVLKSVNGFYVFMDTNYNVLHMGNCFYKGSTDLEQIAHLVYYDFCTFFPLPNFSLQQILELATSLKVYSQNYTIEESKYLGKLIYLMGFLREEVNYYFNSIYPLMCMKMVTPDVFAYISGVIANIKEVIEKAVSEGIEPKVDDILVRLGRNDLAASMYSSIHYIIELLVNYRDVDCLDLDKKFINLLGDKQNKGR